MAYSLERIVKDGADVPVSGTQVYVYDSNGLLAPLVTELNVAAPNPAVSDSLGYAAIFVADVGTYTLSYYWGGRERKIETVIIYGGSVLPASTDGTLAGNSDTVVPTQKAVKTYVDARADAAAAGAHFYATRAEAVAALAVGAYFTSAETGTLRMYQRTGTTPFYLDQGDEAAPASKAMIENPSILNIRSSETSTTFVRPSLNVPDGTMFKSATTDFETDKPMEFIGSTLLFEPSTKLALNPTPNSFAQGLAITQSAPSSGTEDGPFYFNVIDATIRSALTTGGIPGNPGSGTWTGFQCSINAGGVNYDGDSVMGGSFGVVQTLADTSLGDKNGLSSGVVINAFTLGKGYGGSSGATVGPGGSCPAMIGYETDVIIESENVDHVVGFNSWTGGSKVGIYTHAAYTIGAAGGMGQHGNGVAGWQTGFRLYTQGGLTNEPMAADGSLFDSDHDATLAYIFDFNNVLVTEDVIRLNNNAVRLTGAGALSLNTPIAGLGVGKAATSSAWIATEASTTTKAALNLASGAAPTSPNNGDIWFDGTHLYCRIGGVTKQLDN